MKVEEEFNNNSTEIHSPFPTHKRSLVAMETIHGYRLLHGVARGPAEIRGPDCCLLGSPRTPAPTSQILFPYTRTNTLP